MSDVTDQYLIRDRSRTENKYESLRRTGTEGLGGDDYTDLTQMGLDTLKSHLVVKLVCTAEPTQNHDGTLDDTGLLRSGNP